MPATTWIPKPVAQRRQFLLANEEIVPEPLLEQTPAGRRVRLYGNAGSARPVAQQESVIKEGLAQVALQKKTHVWMPIDLDERYLKSIAHGAFDYEAEPVAQFDIGPKKANGPVRKMRVWWTFKHPTLPIKAILAVNVTRHTATGLRVRCEAWIPDTQTGSSTPSYTRVEDPAMDAIENGLPPRLAQEWPNFLQMVRDPWFNALMVSGTTLLERPVVETVLSLLREIEGLDEIQIPDLRDSALEWMSLEADDSNINSQFIDDLVEYLDTPSAIEKAAEHYAGLVAALRAAGMVLPEKLSDNAFHEALTNGTDSALVVRLGTALDPDSMPDRTHHIAIHLPTGSFVVECTKGDGKEDAAHAWNEALLVAQLTGKEREFLNFYRAFGEGRVQERAKKIVRHRKQQMNPNPKRKK